MLALECAAVLSSLPEECNAESMVREYGRHIQLDSIDQAVEASVEDALRLCIQHPGKCTESMYNQLVVMVCGNPNLEMVSLLVEKVEGGEMSQTEKSRVLFNLYSLLSADSVLRCHVLMVLIRTADESVARAILAGLARVVGSWGLDPALGRGLFRPAIDRARQLGEEELVFQQCLACLTAFGADEEMLQVAVTSAIRSRFPYSLEPLAAMTPADSSVHQLVEIVSSGCWAHYRAWEDRDKTLLALGIRVDELEPRMRLLAIVSWLINAGPGSYNLDQLADHAQVTSLDLESLLMHLVANGLVVGSIDDLHGLFHYRFPGNRYIEQTGRWDLAESKLRMLQGMVCNQ